MQNHLMFDSRKSIFCDIRYRRRNINISQIPASEKSFLPDFSNSGFQTYFFQIGAIGKFMFFQSGDISWYRYLFHLNSSGKLPVQSLESFAESDFLYRTERFTALTRYFNASCKSICFKLSNRIRKNYIATRQCLSSNLSHRFAVNIRHDRIGMHLPVRQFHMSRHGIGIRGGIVCVDDILPGDSFLLCFCSNRCSQ